MSEATESNLNEMMAGDGSGLALPPAFVFVNTKKRKTYGKKGNDSVDGRTKGAKTMLSRITKRKMKKEETIPAGYTARVDIESIEPIISESVPSETERAQKQIGQMKKLNRSKDLQKKRDDAKTKMMSKTKEMDTLMKARLSDFKKKAHDQTKKLKKEENTIDDTVIIENTDALQVALQVATQELNPAGETSFAKIDFSDGTTQNLDSFSAKRIAATYAQLDEPKQQQFRYMLNKDAVTYQSALDFAIRNN